MFPFARSLLVGLVMLASVPAEAQTTVVQSTSSDITAFGVCLTVTNTCDGDIMIPNASSAEFYGVPGAWGANLCAIAGFCGSNNSDGTISASYLTSCGVLADHTAMCWGQCGNGQCGDGTTTGNYNVPVTVSGGYSWQRVTAYASSGAACGIRTDGVAMCWGSGGSGALGNGTTTSAQTTPVVVSGGYTWNAIASGSNLVCGIRTDGVAMCWGSGVNGQRGDGATAGSVTSPVVVSGGYTWRQISAGAGMTGTGHVCGVRTDGVGMCWGVGGSGQLGDGTTTAAQSTPVTVSGGYTWRSISAGYQTTCGIRTDGAAMCWGLGASGALGDGTNTAAQTTPVLVSGGYSWKSLDVMAHVCGIRTDGVAMCWGLGSNGALGDGGTSNSNVPVTVSGGYTWRAIDVGSGPHTCGIRTDSVAMCWGKGSSGQRGGGGYGSTQTTPATVSGGYTW